MKYRDPERMLSAAEKLVDLLGNCPELLDKLQNVLTLLPTEGFSRKQLWRLQQAKARTEEFIARRNVTSDACQS